MKMYKTVENEEGEKSVQTCNCDTAQREIMVGAGWRTTAEEVVAEVVETEPELTPKEKIAAEKAAKKAAKENK